MTLKTYLLGMFVSTIICFFSCILILLYVNPESGIIGQILFILMLFFFMTGFFTLLGFYVRKKILHNKYGFKITGISFRQGVLFSLIFIGMLFLNKFNMLFWWSAALFIVATCLLEFYFNSKD